MIYEFDPVIYPRKLWITYDATPEELNEKFPSGDINGNKFKQEEGYYGMTEQVCLQEPDGSNGSGGILIRFDGNTKAMTPWNIAHEAIHAAGYICNYVGIAADWENDEAFTYLATWIIKCCEEVKQKEEKQ